MKKISDFEPQALKRKSDLTESILFAGIVVFAVLMTGLALSQDVSGPAVNALCFFGGCGSVGLTVAAHIRARSRLLLATQAGYWRYLDSLPLAKLRLATTSPELDLHSRESITTYLSAHHPGWSFYGSMEVSHA